MDKLKKKVYDSFIWGMSCCSLKDSTLCTNGHGEIELFVDGIKLVVTKLATVILTVFLLILCERE